MKKISKIFALFVFITMMFASCTPDSYELGAIDVKAEDLVEGIAYKIEHDASNPNIVYLTSLMESKYTPVWSHPQGRSVKSKVKLEIAFPGTYEVKFGVMTRGGLVYGEPVSFEIDDFYAGFVSDALWTMLSGGVDNEKTWYLDLDADGVSRYFTGPLYFYGTDDSWETVTNGVTLPEGSDSWSWQADWPGNKWMMDAANFGTMTFNLKGGANVTVEHLTIPSRGTETGTYMLSVEEHTMRIVDASPLHDTNRDGQVIDWGDIKILSLTENTMQLGVLRDAALSGEGACLLVYNYISKDYYDNWEPGEPEPPYTGNANDDLTSTFTKKWKMSVETPYNWTELDGTFLNNWSSAADYASAGYDYNQAMIKNISLSMTKTGEDTGNYIFTDGNAAEIKGSYETDEKNNIIFDQDISFVISGSQKLSTTTKDKALRIIRSETNESGELSGLWFGKRDETKEEYMVYHFELVTSGSGEGNEGTEVSFDASKILYGDLEGKGNLRIEIYNEYGAGTASNPPLDKDNFSFAGSVSVTFTLTGATNAGATGSYDASIYFADADWNPQGNGAVVNVNGDGTYTVQFNSAGTTAEGIMVFVVDIVGMAADITDMSSVKATVDKIVVK